MITRFETALAQQREALYPLFQDLVRFGRPFLLRSDVADAVDRFREREPEAAARLSDAALTQWFPQIQEAVVGPSWICLAMRTQIARWLYVRVHVEDMVAENLTVQAYLELKEQVIVGPAPFGGQPLELDIGPFMRGVPTMNKSKSIGRGVEFLNRHLASQMFRDREAAGNQLLRFLKLHHVDGHSLMLNERMADLQALDENLREALSYVQSRSPHTPWKDLAADLQSLGLEPGWGANAGRVRDTLELLADLLEAPDAPTLERFLSRIPMIFRIAIITPHGWFGQDGVVELKRAISDGGRMIVLHPFVQGFAANDELVWPILDLAEAERIPVYFHTGPHGSATPFQIMSLALRYPQVDFIIGHCGATDFWYVVVAAVLTCFDVRLPFRS